MLLNEVISILKRPVEGMGYTNTSFYILLFSCLDESANEDEPGIDDIVKQVFSKRGLKRDLMSKLMTRKHFKRFAAHIQNEYLTKITDREYLCRELYRIIEECIYLPQGLKEELKNQSNIEISCFVAACIICGSYNSRYVFSERKNKIYTLTLGFLPLKCELLEPQYQVARCRLEMPIRYSIWSASQSFFIQSHKEGNRFYALDIIERLLPKGYPIPHKSFHLKGQLEDGMLADISQLCTEINQNIALIGVGGIGKTTFLQQLMADTYWNDPISRSEAGYAAEKAIPIFIELNRCPSDIGDWYDSSLGKTNFITRFVGQMIENHTSINKVSENIIENVEKEFQKIPTNGKPEYLLLLDGFNEVSTKNASNSTMSVRALLSNEIARLNEYANIRLITTSRETQSACFAEKFQNIFLQGVLEDDIIDHLKNNNFSETEIGLIRSKEALWDCLKIPLFLCMFSLEQGRDYLPETQGEILYAFFHRNSAFYNARQRFSETGTSELDMPQVAVILDFILPYIGWHFDDSDVFSLPASEFKDVIVSGARMIEDIFLLSDSNPYADFSYQSADLKEAHQRLYDMEGRLRIADIIACIHGYLGICYAYTESKGDFAARSRYAFIHHYFRDYFSAIYEIRILELLSCINIADLQTSGKNLTELTGFLDHGHWHSNKTELISQVLMEHHNRPKLSELDGNWYLPEPVWDEQSVLINSLTFHRQGRKNGMEFHYLLPNILSAMLYGRKELSGLDLSGLDFRYCNFFNVQCAKKGKDQNLTADFNDTSLYLDNFSPVEHMDEIIEYIYSGSRCFTIDRTGIIKCWDIFSGKQEYILKSGEPEIHSSLTRGFMRLTDEKGWLIARVQSKSGVETAYLNIFDLNAPEQLPRVWKPDKFVKHFTFLGLTGDKQHIICIGEEKDIYFVDIEDAVTGLQHTAGELFNHTELYADTLDAPYYVFTSEYYEYDFEEPDEAFDEEDYSEYEEDDGAEEWNTIPCIILCCQSGFQENTLLYSYYGSYSIEGGVRPTVCYFPDKNCFLLYNEETKRIERLNCTEGKVYPILSYFAGNHPPFIYPHPLNGNECYIMYGDYCYHADISINNIKNGGIITKYQASSLKQALHITSSIDTLMFRINAAPSTSRLLITDEVKTYEWDLSNDNVRLRYNAADYDSCDTIKDTLHGLFLLIHSYNGVTVLAENPLRLVFSYCFTYDGYYISGSTYHENTQQLALLFSKPGHDFVRILYLADSNSRTVFSTLHNNDTIESIIFTDNGKYILITTNNNTWEYALETDKIYMVASVSENELFVGGEYVDGGIEIAVAMRFAYEKPDIMPRMDNYQVKYQKGIPVYSKCGYHLLPHLPAGLLGDFIHKYHDLGRACCFDGNGMQKYWITRGFFKESTEDIAALLNVGYYSGTGNQVNTCKKSLPLFRMIYVVHDKPLYNPYRTETNVNTYSYVADDFSNALLIHDYERLLYYPDLLHTLGVYNTYDYRESNRKGGNIYWDSALPFNSSTSVLCCYDIFRVMEVDIDTNETNDVVYEPGIAIYGCSFENARFDCEDAELLVKRNGGIKHVGW